MIQSNLFRVWKNKEAEMGRDLTQAEVAEATGVSQATLSRWMNRQVTRFDAPTVTALTEYFGCGVEELLVENREEA